MKTSLKAITPSNWQTEPFPYGFGCDLSPMNATRIYSDDPGPENDFTIGYAVGVDRPTREANAKLLSSAPEMAKLLLKVSKSLWRDFDSDDADTSTMDAIDALLKEVGAL